MAGIALNRSVRPCFHTRWQVFVSIPVDMLESVFNVKISLVSLKRKWPKLLIPEMFIAASKIKWLDIFRISEISGKLWLKWVKNVLSRRIFICRDVYPTQNGVQQPQPHQTGFHSRDMDDFEQDMNFALI